MASMSSKKSFTLIELVIVIGILAVLATTVILVLNPSELLKQSRDTRRLSDLASLNSALGLYQSDGNTSFGTSSVVYVSLPDSSPTCNNLGLPTLPSGWSYACSNSTNYRKVDSTGWIPVNLTLISFGSPLDTLPIDPVNSTSSRNYYTYTPGGSWELTTSLESQKYKLGGGNDKASTDGGQYTGLYETGSNLTLEPIDYGDPSLMGYWKFDEGSGTTATDSSGQGNTGTWHGISPYYVTGKVGSYAGQFNGTDDYALMQPNISYGTITGWSASMWVNGNPPASGYSRLWSSTGWNPGFIFALVSNDTIRVYSWDTIEQSLSTTDILSNNTWYYIAFTWNGNTGEIKIYINGALSASAITTTHSFGFNNGQSIIGGQNNYYNGKIDDVRIYNRALSAAEISATYNATK